MDLKKFFEQFLFLLLLVWMYLEECVFLVERSRCEHWKFMNGENISWGEDVEKERVMGGVKRGLKSLGIDLLRRNVVDTRSDL